MKILITPRGYETYGMDYINIMRNKGHEVIYNGTGNQYTKDEFLKLSTDVDAIIVGVDIIDKEFIDQCSNLKVICKFGVGIDNIDVDYAESKGILVGKTIGSNSRSVAEHVMALMYSESKNIVTSINEVKNGKWNKITGRELSDKTIGIIGFGSIGKELAIQAKGIGMDVFVYDMYEISIEELERYSVNQVDLNTLISKSDYVSLHLPLTEETQSIISSKEFSLMKKNGCLINSSRGGIVDESELFKALTEGKIRSACFDVFSTEPPSIHEPLLSLPNFYLTPHIGSRTVESEKRTCQISSEIILKGLEKNI